MKERKRMAHRNFTTHDAKLIDDLRRAFAATQLVLPKGAFDGSNPVTQMGFEKAVAKLILEREKP